MTVAVRLTPAVAEAFDLTAARWGLSRGDALHRLVTAQVDHDRARRADVVSRLKS